MGDRALIIIKDNAEYSPAIYLHQHGGYAANYIEELAAIMKDRGSDVHYATARLAGICHTRIEGNTGLGIFAIDEEAVRENPSSASYGDRGVFIVDADNEYTYKQYA